MGRVRRFLTRLEPAATVADLGAMVLFACGVIADLNTLHRTFGVFDEALISLNASLINGGAVPCRDFYSNYPPGLFYLVGLLFRVFGENVLVTRFFGLVVHLALALLAGRVAGQLRGRRFAWMPAGLMMLWLAQLELTPFAYLTGLCWALGAIALFQRARDRGTRGAWLLTGACVGIGSFFRHDLFLFLAVVLTVVAATWWALFHRKRFEATHARALGWFVLGAATLELVLWGPLFARAGAQPIYDLALDQIRHVQPGRLLPVPWLLAMTEPHGPWSVKSALPAMFHEQLEGAMLFVFVGPFAFAAALLAARRLGLDRPIVCTVGALALATLPQTLGRTDMHHAIYGIVAPVILLWCLAEALAAKLPKPALLLPMVPVLIFLSYPARSAITMRVRITPVEPLMQNPRGKGAIGFEIRDELVQAIQSRTQPGEPIFVGLTDHRRTVANELDLYWLSERPGSTRYLQFDPNLTNREDVQEQMIRELEMKGTRLLVLSKKYTDREEPNQSAIYRSALLDAYFALNFHRVQQLNETYSIWMRNP